MALHSRMLLFTVFPILLLFFFTPFECSLSSRRLKILVYSQGICLSHNQFLGKIADTLQEAGHEVHFLKFMSADYLAQRNETKLVHKVHLAYPSSKNAADELDVQKMDEINNSFAGERPILSAMEHKWREFLPKMAKICKEISLNTKLLNALESEHFDVGIAELYDLCPFAILHRIGIPTKLASTAVPLYQMAARHFGIPTFSSFVPHPFVSSMDAPNFGFFGRLLNFYDDFYDWLVIDDWARYSEEPFLLETFGQNFPKLRQIVRNVSLYFVNSNPFLDYPRPISNKIIYIGGLVSPKQERQLLDKKMQQILNNALRGAVLISFGSLAKSNRMGPQMRHSLLRAFSLFHEYKFIWKLDQESQQNDSALFASTPNVHAFEWVQQTALLAHPKMRAFISHCGWNSVNEAAESGIPVLGIPLFADQHKNALLAQHQGMGLYLDVKELNGPGAEEIMTEMLEKVLLNPFYRQNAQLIQRKLALSPFSAVEKLIRWVEFSAKFPDLNELNLPGESGFGWFAYYSVDCILFTFICLMAILTFIYWIVSKIFLHFMNKLNISKLKKH